MWVFEELVAGEKLTEIINTRHENVKYLPGIRLPGKRLQRLLKKQKIYFTLTLSRLPSF